MNEGIRYKRSKICFGAVFLMTLLIDCLNDYYFQDELAIIYATVFRLTALSVFFIVAYLETKKYPGQKVFDHLEWFAIISVLCRMVAEGSWNLSVQISLLLFSVLLMIIYLILIVQLKCKV